MTQLSKPELRAKMRGERLALSPDLHQTMSADICARALEYCLHRRPDSDALTLAGFSTIHNEPDVYPLLEEWCAPKHTVQWTPYFERHACLPVIAPGSRLLRFGDWKPDSSLFLNRFAIAEPLEDAPPRQPDLVLVPLLAFDRSGMRLGYGAGFYDETLRSLRKSRRITAIGIAFAFQEVAHIPAESFDEPLDLVITEREIIVMSS